MHLSIILISTAGIGVARRVAEGMDATVYSLHSEPDTVSIPSVDDFLRDHWASADALLFVGAMGICVRSIAPYLCDKHTDPAVVCADVSGRHVVSVVSGHVGGANELALGIAALLGADPVVTTASDVTGLWALDVLPRQFGWQAHSSQLNAQISLFTSAAPTALLLCVRDQGTDWLESHLPQHVDLYYDYSDIDQSRYRLLIVVSPQLPQGITLPYVHYFRPRSLRMGVGLAHQAGPVYEVLQEMKAALQEQGIPPEAVRTVATIEEKRHEPVVQELGRTYELEFLSAEALSRVSVPHPSDTVLRYMGTPSVSEAATLQGGERRLLVPKQKGHLWTFAVAADEAMFRHGRVEIVGAGPGDPDLISVRGRLMLQRADLILYAGSLVPKRLTDCAKPGATVRSSAGMHLEEQVELMKSFCDRGLFVVRLHTGDPSLYGAIQEQMNRFDQLGITYHLTPGISAFQAASAELRSQFTIPRRVQTIILTRGDGRTPMPEREQLHLLARSRSTMCIYLSADIVEKVEQELLQEYPPTTPVAVCYRLTWPEQRIYRGTLSELTTLVRSNRLTLDTLIVVGDAIGNREGLSELYSPHFTHLFRKGDQ